MRCGFDFSMRFNLCRRQMSEHGQILMARSWGVGVVSVLPIERRERSGHPVEIVAYNAALALGRAKDR